MMKNEKICLQTRRWSLCCACVFLERLKHVSKVNLVLVVKWLEKRQKIVFLIILLIELPTTVQMPILYAEFLGRNLFMLSSLQIVETQNCNRWNNFCSSLVYMDEKHYLCPRLDRRFALATAQPQSCSRIFRKITTLTFLLTRIIANLR